MDCQELLVDQLPRERRKMLEGVADACHLHVHRVGTMMGLGALSQCGLGVKSNFYDVDLVTAGPMSMYADTAGLARSHAERYKAFVQLNAVPTMVRAPGHLRRAGVPVDNLVSSVSLEAAICLLSGKNDLLTMGPSSPEVDDSLATTRCPSCKQLLRGPVGRLLRIRCTNCGHRWEGIFDS